MKVDLKDIQEAREKIGDVVKNTEFDYSESATQFLGCKTFFKFENQQLTGSFKIRGALNKIRCLTDSERAAGVIACSAGNHAQGVAMSATLSGVTSTVVMPDMASLVKVAATQGYGANVEFYGQVLDESKIRAEEIQREQKSIYIDPFADERVIAGQGTLGLEIIEKAPELDSLVIPIGGGGLISGIATAVKALSPKTRIIGVQSEQAPGMYELFTSGNTVKRQGRIKTIADGIAMKAPNPVIFDSFISKLVDEIVTVSDFEISEAIVFLLERAKSLAEGSGAASLAAAMAGKVNLGKSTCILISGGNADLNIISKVIDRGLQRKGRLAHISVIVDDVPGNLSAMTNVIAQLRANVLEVRHSRTETGVYLRETQIDFVLEANGEEHIEKIKAEIKKLGVRILK